MKNFCEAMVIRNKLTLLVIIELKSINNCWCKVEVNGELIHQGAMFATSELRQHVPLNEPLHIKITSNNEHNQAIDIKKITVDGFEVMPLYQAHAKPSTSYLDKSTEWEINIPSFYPWYHEITGQGWII